MVQGLAVQADAPAVGPDLELLERGAAVDLQPVGGLAVEEQELRAHVLRREVLVGGEPLPVGDRLGQLVVRRRRDRVAVRGTPGSSAPAPPD